MIRPYRIAAVVLLLLAVLAAWEGAWTLSAIFGGVTALEIWNYRNYRAWVRRSRLYDTILPHIHARLPGQRTTRDDGSVAYEIDGLFVAVAEVAETLERRVRPSCCPLCFSKHGTTCGATRRFGVSG